MPSDEQSPGLGIAVPVSQIDLGDLRVWAAAPVGGGRRWSPLTGLGRPRDGPGAITTVWLGPTHCRTRERYHPGVKVPCPRYQSQRSRSLSR